MSKSERTPLDWFSNSPPSLEAVKTWRPRMTKAARFKANKAKRAADRKAAKGSDSFVMKARASRSRRNMR